MPHMGPHVPTNKVYMLNEIGRGVTSVHDCRRDARSEVGDGRGSHVCSPHRCLLRQTARQPASQPASQTKESSYTSSFISSSSQYSSPSLSLSSFSNRHPRQQKNNRTEQQQNNQRQSGSHETLSSTESHFFSDFDGWKLERTWRGNRSTSIEWRAHGGVRKN